MLKKTLFLLLCSAFMATNLFAEPAAYDFTEKTPKNSALRSLILPGWGQYFNGQTNKGYIVFGAAILTLAGSIALNAKANSTYDDYQAAGAKNGPIYSDYETQADQAAMVSYVCAGVWIYGIIDAYISGRQRVSQDESSAGFSVACGKGRSNLYYSKRF